MSYIYDDWGDPPPEIPDQESLADIEDRAERLEQAQLKAEAEAEAQQEFDHDNE